MKFVGKNLLPEEYPRLSFEERAALQWRLKQQNRNWLQKQFAKLNAAWLVVVDGKVIASGKTLKNRPTSPQILKICRRTGKFPFIFVNDKFITIEEAIAPTELERESTSARGHGAFLNSYADEDEGLYDE